MKRMNCSRWGALPSEKTKACAEVVEVRNIRNIQINRKNIQSIQSFNSINLFRHCWNKPERPGTNLFRHVPPMFRSAISPEQRYNPRPTGFSAVYLNGVFRNVPVEPEQANQAGSPVRRGFQIFLCPVFRMFRAFRSPAHVFNVGEPKMTALNTPARSEMPPKPLDFAHCWQQAVELVGLSSAVPLVTTLKELSIAGAGISPLLKRLQSLDTPRRALLLTMACMANPKRADWLQGEVGLHFGQLTAADLGTEVFQVLVGLLASFPFASATPDPLDHCECPGDWSDLEQLVGRCTRCKHPALF
ncbi:hypothetical protein M1B35_30185 [Pseudomonas sp. MAFF 302046]|uniref:Uncharacterized protein n=1 Tax=Pseudomonas morbosilactucae TaxID=2938197 RepID=A0ABT0JQT8_9PSED|nr:hypothetical protein [Pseudomonas morbosilactucae]MCK9818276.1 hypothetical protein [Pseudomonas morbosilactucae]